MKIRYVAAIFFFTGTMTMLFIYTVKMHREYADLKLLIQAQLDQPARTEIVERLISSGITWADLQNNVKDTVVQIFSQVAAVDLLQPYKTPHQQPVTGSGFFINDEGEIITNAHVVDQAKAVWIQIPSLGKQQIDVEVIGVSPDRDLALLRVKKEGLELIRSALGTLPYLMLGNSDLVHRGDEIMTLGYPLGQQGIKSTVGVVSGLEGHFIQIDAPINPGNSGGPSVNKNGMVIGINTAGYLEAQNVGYIIPINELKLVIDELRKTKLLRKPFLGILFNNASESLTSYLGNPSPGGLYVVNVFKNSPLAKAGVQPSDMIYNINGHDLDIYGELLWNDEKISIIDYVSQLKLGQEVHLIVWRKGKRHDITLIFDQVDPLPIKRIYPGYEKIDYEIIAGMVIQPLTINHLPLLVNIAPSLAKYAEMQNQLEPALIITHIFPDSQAHRSRALAPGFVLKEINGQTVKTMDDLRQALFKGLSSENLTIQTAEGIFVVCPFKKVLRDDMRLAHDYFFPLSATMKTLIAKAHIEPEKHKEFNFITADNNIKNVAEAA